MLPDLSIHARLLRGPRQHVRLSGRGGIDDGDQQHHTLLSHSGGHRGTSISICMLTSSFIYPDILHQMLFATCQLSLSYESVEYLFLFCLVRSPDLQSTEYEVQCNILFTFGASLKEKPGSRVAGVGSCPDKHRVRQTAYIMNQIIWKVNQHFSIPLVSRVHPSPGFVIPWLGGGPVPVPGDVSLGRQGWVLSNFLNQTTL